MDISSDSDSNLLKNIVDNDCEDMERTKLIMDDENSAKIKNFVNNIWKNEVIPFLDNISETNKIDKDYLKLQFKNQFQKKKIKLSKYYSLDQDISEELHNNMCIARVWNKGVGNKQCSNEIKHGSFCKKHYRQFMKCKEMNCIRGTCGLGACNCGKHGGLWLGSILKPIKKNDKGETVIQWNDSSKKRKIVKTELK